MPQPTMIEIITDAINPYKRCVLSQLYEAKRQMRVCDGNDHLATSLAYLHELSLIEFMSRLLINDAYLTSQNRELD
jgi:hypothetical protein